MLSNSCISKIKNLFTDHPNSKFRLNFRKRYITGFNPRVILRTNSVIVHANEVRHNVFAK